MCARPPVEVYDLPPGGENGLGRLLQLLQHPVVQGTHTIAAGPDDFDPAQGFGAGAGAGVFGWSREPSLWPRSGSGSTLNIFVMIHEN